MDKVAILVVALLLSACTNGSSQPLAPGAVSSAATASLTAGGANSTPLDHRGPTHFDPPPIEGWNNVKWHDLTFTSPKYVFGRALVGLDPNDENLQKVAEAQGLTYLGNGRVRFADGTTVDAILGRNSPRPRWQFHVI